MPQTLYHGQFDAEALVDRLNKLADLEPPESFSHHQEAARSRDRAIRAENGLRHQDSGHLQLVQLSKLDRSPVAKLLSSMQSAEILRPGSN